MGGGVGGVQARLTEKSSDVVFFFVFVSPQLILQRESSDHCFFLNKTIIKP